MMMFLTTANHSRASGPSGPGRLFTLHNDRDMAVTISEHGAALMAWWAPDRYGRLADVVMAGADSLAEPGHPGSLRRLAPAGWQGTMDGRCVTLRHASEELAVELSYRLDDEGRLSIEHHVGAREESTVDLGAHPRFNLTGGRGDVADHMLQIEADHYLKIDRGGIPMDVAPVEGTAFDFRKPAAIGPRLVWPDVQIGLAGGFGHCFQVGAERGQLRVVARVYDPRSGRRLQVATTEAGLGFCTDTQGGSPDGAGLRLQPCSHPEHLGVGLAAAVIVSPRNVFRRTTVYQLTLQL
ncbi:aldose epimerase family protein [Massilia terrae]